MSHYKIGSDIYIHKGKAVRTIVGNPEAIAFVGNLGFKDILDYGYIPTGFEFRPDLIANIYYDDPDMFWFIMMYNAKADVVEDFRSNERLLFPRI